MVAFLEAISSSSVHRCSAVEGFYPTIPFLSTQTYVGTGVMYYPALPFDSVVVIAALKTAILRSGRDLATGRFTKVR